MTAQLTDQQGDVNLFQTFDGGDIIVEGGVVQMVPGLGVQAYLCLFGGNDDDDGSQDSVLGWWGNIDEIDPDFKYVSQTQHLLRSIPSTSSNRLRLEDAATSDLSVFISKQIASSVSVSVTVPGLNKVAFNISIIADGVESNFNFVQNWKASA